MAKRVMRRTAGEGLYYHPDFHGALSASLDYLERHYGVEGVREFLRRFARACYAPLVAGLQERGLVALEEHFREVYRFEGGEAQITRTEETLVVKVRACPAVQHMRRRGYPVAHLWGETLRTVGEALCEGTPYAVELCVYDPEGGGSIECFYRRRR